MSERTERVATPTPPPPEPPADLYDLLHEQSTVTHRARFHDGCAACVAWKEVARHRAHNWIEFCEFLMTDPSEEQMTTWDDALEKRAVAAEKLVASGDFRVPLGLAPQPTAEPPVTEELERLVEAARNVVEVRYGIAPLPTDGDYGLDEAIINLQCELPPTVESYISVGPTDTDWTVEDIRGLTEREIETWNATERPWPYELLWRAVLLNAIDELLTPATDGPCEEFLTGDPDYPHICARCGHEEQGH